MTTQATGILLFLQICTGLALILFLITLVILALTGFFEFREKDPNKAEKDNEEDSEEEDSSGNEGWQLLGEPKDK